MFNNFIKMILMAVLVTQVQNASATWSIIAVDRATGEIGIAGASCTFDVQGIASIVPGKGAIVVQAASNYFARMKGVGLMSEGGSVQEVLEAMSAGEFDPERQQYGVLLLDDNSKPLVKSGNQIKGWSGEKVGDDFAVMGNILVGGDVLANAFGKYNSMLENKFDDRLMGALKAGELAGGDKRCGPQAARSAFISVYNPRNGAIVKLSVHGIEKGGKPAVTLLEQQFEKINGK